MGVRAQAVQIDNLAKQTLAMAAAAGVDPLLWPSESDSLAQQKE